MAHNKTRSDLKSRIRMLVGSLGFILCMVPSSAAGETCEVPSASYPTIESAMQVINCTEIVLTSDLFFGDLTIDRTLVLRGTSSEETTIFGRVVVQGETTEAQLWGLGIAVNPIYFPGQVLVIEGDADALAEDVTVSATNLIFLDGFEWGDDSRW